MTLIQEIIAKVRLEMRMDSKEYLEAVVPKQGLELLQSILSKHLGPAAKKAGEKATFPPSIQKLVDSLGGLRIEQSFYYKQEGKQVIFAALWPWATNPDKVTLKSGVSDL